MDQLTNSVGAITLNSPPVVHRSSKTNVHLVAFFAQFADFEYDPSKPVTSEFQRLKATSQWKRGINRGLSLEKYKLALVLQFNETYGTDQNDLASWQNLCLAVNIKDAPESITACKKAIDKTHVNLVDLVDKPNTNQNVKRFKNVQRLRKYTIETDKIFPKNIAKAGGILKHLLRVISPFPPKPRR